MSEITLGYIRHLTPWATVRPEIRYDHSYNVPAYDNGTKSDQFTFSADLILKF